MKKAKSKKSNGRLRRILLSKQFCITVLVVMTLLALLCLVKVILGFMPVEKFELRGETHYELVEIRNSSGIGKGEKLYRINEKKAEENIIKSCPYVKSVKIKQKFPNTVVFVVEERESGWYIQVGENFYGLDYDLRILNETYLEDEFIERGLTKLTLPELESGIVGELPNFASEDEQLLTETLEIVEAFRSHEIKSRLTGLDISNRIEIKLEIDNAYEVYFGDMTSFDIKIKALTEVLRKSAEEYGFSGGKITWDEGYGSFALKGVSPDPTEIETDENGETVKADESED